MILNRDERGAIAIEYALIGAIVGLGIITSLVSTKRSLNTAYDKISFQMGNSVSSGPAAARVVASTATSSYSLNGIVLTQTYTTYTDGTKSMVQTNSNPAVSGFGVVDYQFDKTGNVISSYVRNPDGSFQYSDTITPLRDGTGVHTLATASGVTYSYSAAQSVSGAITTIDNTMLDPGTSTGLWTTQRIVVDATDPANTVSRITCTFGSGSYVAC